MKRIAWITAASYFSTDRFIIPVLAKYYAIDCYIFARESEKIDFIDGFAELSRQCGFHYEIVIQKKRNSSMNTAMADTKFLKDIKRKRYDMVYNVMFGVPYYMPLLRIIIGNRKVLIAIHNVHVPKGGSAYLRSILYTNYTIRSFMHFQTFSASQKKALLQIAPRKDCDNAELALIDYGAPTIGRNDDIITFLSFGIIRDYKRVDVIIRAAENAYEQTGILFRVIIAGACDEWDKYNALIRHPELFDLRIRRIEDSEVANLFAESHYFVAPYQDIAQSGSAIVAVNYNVPVIASRLEAFETYVEDGVTGFLIEPASVDELSEVFKKVLRRHHSFYAEICRNVAERKEKQFSAEAVSKLYMRNFERTMEG